MTMVTTPEPVYTVAEFADALRISKSSAHNWVREGKVRAIRIGRTVRITQSALDEVREMNNAADQPTSAA